MADGHLNWSEAETEARRIAEAWGAEAGPGGAVALLDRDGVRAEFSGGFASIEQRIAFTPATACRYASVSKHFLCALVTSGSDIDLAAPLGRYLPLSPAVGAVETGRALDMTGGLPDTMETFWLLGVPPTAALDRDALLRFASRFPATNFPPGTEISYSNTGYRLVQAALERDGGSYFSNLHTLFLAPLGLGIRLPEDFSEPVPDLATGYWREGEAWRIGQYGMHISASGGLAGSARDLATWCAALLAGRGPAAAVLDRLSAPRRLADGRTTAYGLGLAGLSLGGHRLVGHGGSLPGYKTHFLLDPKSGAGAVLVSNREDTLAAGLCQQIMAALLGAALPKPSGGLLASGLYVDPDAPFWLETAESSATFLGAQEDLVDAGDGAATGLSAHMPMRLAMYGADITGEIGHVARRFRPVSPNTRLGPGWSGQWQVPGENSRIEIDAGEMRAGVGPLARSYTLQPLSPNGALVTRGDRGPWRQRACLWLHAGAIRAVTNRSRILRFEPVPR